MSEAIGEVLPLGVGVALSPLPIIAVILMHVSRRARVNGPLFILGWLVGLGVVGVVVLAVSGPSDANDNGEPARWVAALQLMLGVLLVVVAISQWRKRPRDGKVVPMPNWMGAV